MATRQQLEQQLVAAHRSGNVQAAQQAAYNIRAYDTAIARGGSGFDFSVPSINAPPPIERVPKPSFGSWLENVGIGIGEGLGEQVQGIGELAQLGVSALGAFAKDPLKASAAAFMGALEPAMRGFTQPAQVAKDIGTGVVETGKQMYQQATSGPIGLGTVIGQNIDLPGPSLPGGRRRPTMAMIDIERDGVKVEVPKPEELAYHGTTKKAAAAIEREGFDLTRSADGTVWLTSNPNIGEVAATGKGGIVSRSVSGMKLGGWDEMDKYSTDQLISMGYDGLKLQDGDEITYQIFNPEKLKVPTKPKVK